MVTPTTGAPGRRRRAIAAVPLRPAESPLLQPAGNTAESQPAFLTPTRRTAAAPAQAERPPLSAVGPAGPLHQDDDAVRRLRAEVVDLRAEVMGLRAEVSVLRQAAARASAAREMADRDSAARDVSDRVAAAREATERDRGPVRSDVHDRRSVPRPADRNRVIELPRDSVARVS